MKRILLDILLGVGIIVVIMGIAYLLTRVL